jgi:hypothetical protein
MKNPTVARQGNRPARRGQSQNKKTAENFPRREKWLLRHRAVKNAAIQNISILTNRRTGSPSATKC